MFYVYNKIMCQINDLIDQLETNLHQQSTYRNALEAYNCSFTRQELEKARYQETQLREKLDQLQVSLRQVDNYVVAYEGFGPVLDRIMENAGFQLGHFPYKCLWDGAAEDEIREPEVNLENLAWARAKRADVVITQCSPETIGRYLRRIVNIAKKGNLRDFLYRLITRLDQTRATFRWTRAAINFLLEMYMICGRASDEIYDLHHKLNSVDTSQLPTKNQLQKYVRLKSVPEKTLPRFLDTLMSCGRDGEIAAMFFQSTILLGLRPIEWQSAFFDEKDPEILIVKNAKYGNGRGCGEYRYLSLENFDDEEYYLVRDTINLIQAGLEETTFAEFMGRIRRVFRQAHKKMFTKAKKRRITPYTGRHQFAANMKRYWGPCGRDIVGALMGHSNDNTACCHYAHANQAMKGGRHGPKADGTNVPLPDATNVAQVRVTNSHFKAMELGANNHSNQCATSSTPERPAYSSLSMSM